MDPLNQPPVAPVPLTSPSSLIGKPSGKNYSFILVISLVIILVGLLIGAAVWYLNSGLNIITYDKNQKSNSDQDYVLSDDIVRLPYSINNSHVNRVSIAYTFDAVFQGLLKQPTETEILLQGGKDLPRFIFKGNQIRYFFFTNERFPAAYASESDLKTGDKIRINASYNLKLKRWFVYHVLIYREDVAREIPGMELESENQLPSP